MANFTAIFDANVLYPAPLRSVLMYLSLADLFRARWTMEIHEEWIRNLLIKRDDLTRAKLEHIRDIMIDIIPDSLVTGYEPSIAGLSLPDNEDRHVLAAALRVNAEVIVTANLKDFPKDYLGQFNVVCQHPDDFILDLIDLDQAKVLLCFKDDRRHYKNPSLTVDEYLLALEKQGLSKTVAYLEDYRDLI
jgi:predicted nucleic acid-binding protein